MRAVVLLIGVALLAALPSAPSAAPGSTCDGIAALKCEEGLWCEHQAGECSVADGAGPWRRPRQHVDLQEVPLHGR